MNLIGQLFDHNKAMEISRRLQERNVPHQVLEEEVEGRTVYSLVTPVQGEELLKAQDFFRVSVGLPGAPAAVDPEWLVIKSAPMGFVTKIIIVFCVVLFGVGLMGQEYRANLYESFFFNTDPLTPWNLLTPIFLHFNFMHIIFNLLWFKDLGSIFEDTKNSRTFIAFIVVVGVLSNISQYLVAGPRFGGMSGIVYGLLGHLWVYRQTHATAIYALPKRDIALMVGWYFLCFTGLLGPIANMAHGVGLGLGMLWGFFPLEKPFKPASLKYLGAALFFCFGTYFLETLF